MEKVENGYSIPKERWLEAEKNIEEFTREFAKTLLKFNHEGMGQKDAADFALDMTLASMALRHVAEFSADRIRILPLLQRSDDT